MLKSTTLLALFLTVGSFSARAQMADRLFDHPTLLKSSADDALVLTREMTSRLHLNEGQFLKLLPLNRTRLSALSSLNFEYRADATLRAAKTAELEAQYEQECSRVLSASQLSQLQRENHAPTTGNGLG